MRYLMALGILYVLVAALVLPTSLFADETAPVDPEAAAAPVVTAPETTPAPEPAPAPAPAPAPTTTAPAPAPQAPAAAPTTTTAPEVQQLPDEQSEPAPKATAAASASVTISDFEFTPATVTVNVGDTVTWTNDGPTGHSATASDGSFDTGVFEAGQSRSATFDTAGTFAYICTPHPNMQGTVIVQAASSQGDSDGTAEEDSTGGTAGSSETDADDGPSLPSTGMDALALAALGLLMLALGVGVRRRSAAESPQPAGRIGW